MASPGSIKADLFVTCIIDQLFPEVGVSVVRVLRRLGVSVGFPEGQTCCGQAVYNSGFTREARRMAERTLRELQDSEYVVAPSGSCSAMMRVFYLDLFEDDPEMLAKAVSLSSRVYEFSEFLVDVLGIEDPGVDRQGTATFHPGCHLLREMEVRHAPQSLLKAIPGLDVKDLRNSENVLRLRRQLLGQDAPHIRRDAERQDSRRARVGADTLVSCDMSCLMHIGGALRRQDPDIQIRHLAQMLDVE